MAVMVELERQWEQGLQPDNTVGGRTERQTFRILVPGRVIAGDRVDRAVPQAFDHRLPVPLAAQRRRELGECPVIADRRLVQCEIGWSGIAGHRQSSRLREPYRLYSGGGRDMGDMVSRSGD